MRKKNPFCRHLVGAIAFLCVLSACIPLFVLPAVASAATAEDDLDFSATGEGYYTEIDALSLYTALYGQPPSDVIADHLAYDSAVKLRISDAIPFDRVSVLKTAEGIAVTAQPYRYTAKNGTDVLFLPYEVTVDGTAYPLTASGDVYTATVSSDDAALGTGCRVGYRAQIAIPAATADSLLNGAYRKAVTLSAEHRAYLDAYAAYLERKAAYNTYLDELEDYRIKADAYATYKERLAVYERKAAAYERYEQALLAYGDAQENYLAYLDALEDYQEKKEAYMAALDQNDEARRQAFLYAQAEEERQAVLSKLDGINATYAPDPTRRTFYRTLMAGYIRSIVKKKEEIVKYTASWDGIPEAIDAADASTKILQKHLTEYKALETDEERYDYYSLHYDAIRDNFVTLYDSLRHLYANPVIASQIAREGRTERYREFLSMLFVFSTCLDDSVALDPSVTIDGVAVSTLVLPPQMVPDTNNADPKGVSLPTLPPEPPALAEIVYPKRPTAVSQPVLPTEVPAPGDAPVPVPLPTLPETVEAPGTPPTPPALLATELALMEALANGELREAPTSAAALQVTTYIDKLAAASEQIAVSYYDDDRRTLLYTETLANGESTSYDGSAPTKETDAQFSYRFLHFATADGTVLGEDGYIPLEDTFFFAVYEKTPITYTVTFLVDGETHTAAFAYGERPVCPAMLTKEADAQYTYYFSGWSPALHPVKGNATYTALYEKVERTYTVTFRTGASEERYVLRYGQTPPTGITPTRAPDALYDYRFIEWDKPILPVREDTVYTARFEALPLALDGDGKPLSVTETKNAYRVEGLTDTFENGALLALAERGYRDVVLSFALGTVTLAPETAARLATSDVKTVILEKTDGGTWRLSFKNSFGEGVAANNINVNINLQGVSVENGTGVYLQGDTKPSATAVLQNGTLTLPSVTVPEEGLTVSLRRAFAISEFDSDNGTVSVPTALAMPGTLLTLTVSPRFGYRLQGVYYMTDRGERKEIDDTLSFVMPEDNVTLYADFEVITYTVTFLSEGTVLSEKTYALGETLTFPTAPSSRREGDDLILFSKWEKTVDPETGDVTYTAVFSRTPVADPENTYKQDYHGWRFGDFLPYVGVGAVALTILTATIIFICFYCRRKRHKKQ